MFISQKYSIFVPFFEKRCKININFLNIQIMCYVIYDFFSKKFVCRRKNVSYPLFVDYLHKARIYKTIKGAYTFKRQIERSRGIETLCIIKLPSYLYESIYN